MYGKKIVIGMRAGSISNWMRFTKVDQMKINKLKDLLEEFGDNVKFEQDPKKRWFNIGGKSKVFFKADN